MKKENMSPMQRWGGEILALVVLVPLVIVIGGVLIKWPALQQQTIETGSREGEALPLATGIILPEDRVVGEMGAGEVKENIDQLQIATLIISGAGESGQYQVALKDGDTVTEIMEQVKSDELINYEAINYGGSLGVFFEEINGVKNNQIKNHYWHLYLNGEKAQVGASSVQVKAGDVIEWRYEEMEEGL